MFVWRRQRETESDTETGRERVGDMDTSIHEQSRLCKYRHVGPELGISEESSTFFRGGWHLNWVGVQGCPGSRADAPFASSSHAVVDEAVQEYPGVLLLAAKPHLFLDS